jgi:sulfhydrogenase subunit beta (sulfur reductase)
MYFLPAANLHTLLTRLEKKYTVYLPEKKNDRRYYTTFKGTTDGYTIAEVRACEPLKSFFFKARQKVAAGFSPAASADASKPLCIVGAKACDLKGFKIEDYVFITPEYTDPFYKRAREENLIVSADCSCAIDTCFCLALGVKPYPEDNFDVNLSQTADGFVLESGSKKGELLLEQNRDLIAECTAEQKKQMREQRNHVQNEVQKNIKKHDIPHETRVKDRVKKNYKYTFWNPQAETCVECGACNVICPTCHCFLLYDQADKREMERLRVWDSCMLKKFARVAGGANPRPELWMRLRNRFEKKFDFFPQVLGLAACTGCGRCISACPAKIDIRKVLGRLAAHA